MTKRAIAIRGLVDQLANLALDGTPIKMGLKGSSTTMSPQDAVIRLHQYHLNITAFLVEILENNPEQAEALMTELGVKWKHPPSE